MVSSYNDRVKRAKILLLHGGIMNSKYKWIFTYASLGVLFLLIAILFYYFPPTGDDWVLMQPKSFSLSEILTRIARDLARQNGRVLGNLMGELLTYSVPRYLLKVIFLITMLSLIHRVTEFDRVLSILYVLTAILTLPIEIFREVWVWSAGFYNYIPPLLLILLLILLCQPGRFDGSLKSNLLLLVIGFAACLFMENLTIYLIFMSIANGVLWLKNRISRHNPVSFGLTIGIWAGALLMFLSPAYRAVSEDGDSYRTMGNSLEKIEALIKENWATFDKLLLSPKFFFVASFLFLFTILLIGKLNRADKKVWISITLGTLWISGLSILSGLTSTIPVTLSILLYFLFYASLAIGGLIALPESLIKLYLFSIASLILMMGPLLIVSPVGPRNFFSPVVFHSIMVILLYRAWKPSRKVQITSAFSVFLLLILFVQFSNLIPMYAANYAVHLERVQIAENAVNGEDEVYYVPEFPFPEALHGSDPSKMQSVYFREEQGDLVFRTEIPEP